MNHYFADPPSKTAFPISKAGYPFIIGLAFITAVFALIDFPIVTLFFLFLTLFTCFFFRDPDRLIPKDPLAIVSPADGTVIDVKLINNCDYLDGEYCKISIFMSILNVHINRIPTGGIVERVEYYPGKYFSANLDKASENNEKNAVILKTSSGNSICFVQIAGLIARRIICGIKTGDSLEKGQKFGLICFGSRLEIYLPPNAKISVVKGSKVKAGSSIVGELSNVN